MIDETNKNGLAKKPYGANAYSLSDVFVRLLGKVCNEITSCFPCNSGRQGTLSLTS